MPSCDAILKIISFSTFPKNDFIFEKIDNFSAFFCLWLSFFGSTRNSLIFFYPSASLWIFFRLLVALPVSILRSAESDYPRTFHSTFSFSNDAQRLVKIAQSNALDNGSVLLIIVLSRNTPNDCWWWTMLYRYIRIYNCITPTDNEPTGFIWRKNPRSESHANEVNSVKAKNILKERMKTQCDYWKKKCVIRSVFSDTAMRWVLLSATKYSCLFTSLQSASNTIPRERFTSFWYAADRLFKFFCFYLRPDRLNS